MFELFLLKFIVKRFNSDFITEFIFANFFNLNVVSNKERFFDFLNLLRLQT